MGKITEMHFAVAIVTMVTINVGGETNIPVAWMREIEVNLPLIGLRLKQYIGRCDYTPWAKSDIYDCLVFVICTAACGD